MGEANSSTYVIAKGIDGLSGEPDLAGQEPVSYPPDREDLEKRILALEKEVKELKISLSSLRLYAHYGNEKDHWRG